MIRPSVPSLFPSPLMSNHAAQLKKSSTPDLLSLTHIPTAFAFSAFNSFKRLSSSVISRIMLVAVPPIKPPATPHPTRRGAVIGKAAGAATVAPPNARQAIIPPAVDSAPTCVILLALEKKSFVSASVKTPSSLNLVIDVQLDENSFSSPAGSIHSLDDKQDEASKSADVDFEITSFAKDNFLAPIRVVLFIDAEGAVPFTTSTVLVMSHCLVILKLLILLKAFSPQVPAFSPPQRMSVPDRLVGHCNGYSPYHTSRLFRLFLLR